MPVAIFGTFWIAAIYILVPPVTYGETMTMRIMGILCGVPAILWCIAHLGDKSHD